MDLGPAQDAALRFAALEVDRDGIIVGWSVSAELMFGQSLAEVPERRLASLLDGADPARLIQALPQARTRAAFTREMTCRRKNGETFYASILMTALDSADGAPPRLMVFIVDDERHRNRDRLIASVAHDLRQPISVIETAAYVLERLPPVATAQRMLARIRGAAGQLRDLTTEMLDLGTARLGGEILLEREHMNLVEVVDEVCTSLQVTHADRLLSIDGADALSGHWDRKRLRRLLQNLLENALAHSPPLSAVRIRCRRVLADVVVSIENDCPEKPATLLEDLFEPFRRASAHGRAGLGLYIARELARAHGGTLVAEWSGGTIRFTLSLPIVIARHPPGAAAHDAPPSQFAVQRRHRRLPFDSDLEVGVGDQLFRAQGHDVSLRGLAFWSDVALEVDERIQVGVSMGPTSFRVLGTVRHVRQSSGRALVGVEFPCDLSQAEIEFLKRPLRN